ncbi:peptidoglycan glycosyltransferase [Thermosipho melanesiensis]|uniref:Peptidoglycan glycosyltransferase n=2 Tax=Thermosipho melanesiensis TaxID=46541 RepID=A6LM78_THEM4|nr:penicillin-binding transpeptidase domain-containing protein [Thermosipho melanesiensis]ABR31029.1 Peptidoglycan glycosyltransferase [Thermosipho melanesiensis BI429]APT74123.1 peptidoglycan glycosyltransferase [Thermosipho melanesiensis]OOC36071.1 peptidoglycan glycosyltransferase [Thermosipho melanesiensis]OOC36888.1 peptidoglycan glycosyltransferase [Thermosipho melanesiensis]OOC37639.1 peptidoglycan glycosyltransferase [Thermosipho melanesiensis]
MRYKTTFFVFILMFSILLFFLVKIQIFDSEKHKEFLDSLLTRTLLTKGLRGTIYDRNGVKLAWSEKYPYLVYTNNIEIEKLKNILTEDQMNEFIKSGEVKLEDYQIYSIENLGYYIQYKEIRRYLPEVLHIVGYLTQGKGSFGLEKAYNDILEGKLGSELVLSTPSGKIQQRIIQRKPENGENLHTSIDFNLQKYIYSQLKEISIPAAVIVENTKTGEILSLVSYPSIDEEFYNIDPYTWRKIIEDPKKPLLNRTTMGLYSPGSSIKPLIAIAYLLSESTPSTVNCTGKFEYKSSSGKTLAIFNDWLLSGHGETDLVKALRVSCNVYFYNIALKMGIDKIKSVADMFRINQKTGIDIEETEGIFPSRNWKQKVQKTTWYPGDTILTGIGQGYILLTPLQLLNFYTTIANNGTTPIPHIVKTKKEYTKLNIPENIWNTIKEGLLEVTTYGGTIKDRGTAYISFKDAPYKIAGKTGTAEVGKGKKSHSWFVGFGPFDSPEYSVVVLFENGGSGSEMAAPFARKIFDYLLGDDKNE